MLSETNFLYGLIFGALLFFACGFWVRETNLVNQWRNRYRFIKNYWRGVGGFLVLLFLAYTYVFLRIETPRQSIWIDMVGQISTVILAVTAGYYGYLQVKRTNLERKFEDARDLYTKRGNEGKSFHRIREAYEKYCDFDPTDFNGHAELLELYVIIGGYDKEFNSRIPLLKTVCHDWEKLVPHFLEATLFLLKEDVGSAKRKIDELVTLAKANPTYYERFSWSFRELNESPAFAALREGTQSKIILMNLQKYLDRDQDMKNKFENRIYDYVLNQPLIPPQ